MTAVLPSHDPFWEHHHSFDNSEDELVVDQLIEDVNLDLAFIYLINLQWLGKMNYQLWLRAAKIRKLQNRPEKEIAYYLDKAKHLVTEMKECDGICYFNEFVSAEFKEYPLYTLFD